MPKLIAAVTLPVQLDKTLNPFSVMNSLFCGRLVRDRFNVLNKYSVINQSDTVDIKPDPINTPLSDLMDSRAEEMIKKGTISLQQSGGVDSTAALLALIKNGVNKNDLEILFDANSCSEYPKLFTWLQEQKFNMTPVNEQKSKLSKVNSNVITNGQCADQLFGSVFFHMRPELYSVSIEDLLRNFTFAGGKCSEEQVQEFTKVYKDYAKEWFNLDLVTSADLGWFINFTVKWSYVSVFNELYLLTTKNQFKSKAFYDTLEFQGQALNNFPNVSKVNIYSKDASQYKKPLKEYCNEVFPDSDYLLNKAKKPSQNARSNGSMMPKMRIAIKNDEGYEAYDAPQQAPAGKYEDFLGIIFTKYKK